MNRISETDERGQPSRHMRAEREQAWVPLASLHITPPAARSPGKTEVNDGGRVALTQSNLNRYIQPPLSYIPNPRAASGPASTTGETTLIDSTSSDQEYFNRVKTYTGYSAEHDPWVKGSTTTERETIPLIDTQPEADVTQ